MNTSRVKDIAGIIVIIITLGFSFARLFFGVELTDEAYSVAETYMVSKGAVPFVNNWSQMPGFSLVLAPFMWIYVVVVGGTSGAVLFIRIICFLINILCALSISYLLSSYIETRISRFLLVMPYAVATGLGTYCFRGDNLGVLFFAVGGIAISCAFHIEDFKRSKRLLLLSGVVFSLGVFCYPTIVIQYLYILIGTLFFSIRKKKRNIIYLTIGSFIAAIPISLYLIAGSGIKGLVNGINNIFKDVMYFQIENDGAGKLSGYIKGMGTEVVRFLILSVIVLGILLIINGPKQNKIGKISYQSVIPFALMIGLCINVIYQIIKFGTEDSANLRVYAITAEFLTVPFIWVFIKDKKRFANYMMLFIWLPTLIWVMLTGVVTWSSMWNRNWMLINGAFLAILFSIWIVEEHLKELTWNRNAIANALIGLIPVLIVMVITLTSIVNDYSYVYRDSSIWDLKTKVLSGPYKGLFTTEERARGLEKLEEVLKENMGKDDYLLAMDNDPFIYLMTDAKVCTPSSWDQSMYSYGFNNPDLYLDYFNTVGREPSKVVYFYYGRGDELSIHKEDYLFNSFINDNYVLEYEDRDFWNWKYSNKDVNCELLIYNKK